MQYNALELLDIGLCLMGDVHWDVYQQRLLMLWCSRRGRGKLMLDDCMQCIKEVLYWKNTVVHLTYACALALLAILHTRRAP